MGQEARERLAEEDQRGDGVVSPHAGRVEGDGVAAVRRQHGPADRPARGFVRRWPRLVVGLRRPRGATTTTWRFSREAREESRGKGEEREGNRGRDRERAALKCVAGGGTVTKGGPEQDKSSRGGRRVRCVETGNLGSHPTKGKIKIWITPVRHGRGWTHTRSRLRWADRHPSYMF